MNWKIPNTPARPNVASEAGGENRTPKNGFTLLELMISIAITVILLGSMYFAFIIGFRKWEQLNILEKMNKEGTFALRRMVRELRQATAIYSTSDLISSDTEIIFNVDINPADTYLVDETVRYYRDSANSFLMREIIGLDSYLLAKNVSSFELQYYRKGDAVIKNPPFDSSDTDIGLIKINLSLQSGNQSTNLKTGVKIRNTLKVVQ